MTSKYITPYLIGMSIMLFSLAAKSETVALSAYNQIIASSKILKFVVPPKTAIDKPIFSNNGKIAIFRFKKEADGKKINVVVETEKGTFSLVLTPLKNAKPKTIHVGGTTSSLTVGDSKNPNMTYVSSVRSILMGQIPNGFQKKEYKKKEVIDFGNFLASSETLFESAYDKIIVYSLNTKHKKSVEVDPSQFYDKFVKAVLLSSSIISPDSKVKLIIVSGKGGE